MKKNSNIIYVFAIILLNSFILIGCSNVGSTTSDPKTSTDKDFLYVKSSPDGNLHTEYSTYYFTKKNYDTENRKIILFGNEHSGKEKLIWDSESLTNYPTYVNTFNNAANMYYDKNTGNFAVAYAYKPFKTFDHSLTLFAGSDASENEESTADQCSINIKIIPDRTFKIHYKCMTGFNILSSNYGVDVKKRITDIFNEANTDVNIVEDKLDYTPEDLNPPAIMTDVYFRNWFDNKRPIPMPNNSVFLFSVKSCTGFGVGNNYGFSPSFNATENNAVYGVCFVFNDNTNNYTNITDPIDKKKFVSTVTLHELGHIRGMLLETPEYPYQYNITGDYHTGGHNGKNKSVCLMRVPENSHDTNYNLDKLKETIASPHFCEGHIQMLYNCVYTEGN